MSEPSQMLSAVTEISERIDRLVTLCRQLAEENRSLRHSQETLASERAQYLARSDQARTRVEAMINRLKSLEHNPS